MKREGIINSASKLYLAPPVSRAWTGQKWPE